VALLLAPVGPIGPIIDAPVPDWMTSRQFSDQR